MVAGAVGLGAAGWMFATGGPATGVSVAVTPDRTGISVSGAFP
jgi:hypothetical protein